MEYKQDEIKKRIATLIKNNSKSLKEISDDLQISYTTLANYAQGRSMPKPDTMQKIADYFGTTVSFIMGTSEERKELNLNEIKVILKNYLEQSNEPGSDRDKMLRLQFSNLKILEMVEKLNEVGKKEDIEFFSRFLPEYIGFLEECLVVNDKRKKKTIVKNVAGLHLFTMNALAHKYLQGKLSESE